MPTQKAGRERATPLLEVMNRPNRPPRTAAVTPRTTPTTPDRIVANRAMKPVTGGACARGHRPVRSSASGCRGDAGQQQPVVGARPRGFGHLGLVVAGVG